jgi:hypothetical protein
VIKTTKDRQFLVAVALNDETAPIAYAMAAGGSQVEAAARATLEALIRLGAAR